MEINPNEVRAELTNTIYELMDENIIHHVTVMGYIIRIVYDNTYGISTQSTDYDCRIVDNIKNLVSLLLALNMKSVSIRSLEDIQNIKIGANIVTFDGTLIESPVKLVDEKNHVIALEDSTELFKWMLVGNFVVEKQQNFTKLYHRYNNRFGVDIQSIYKVSIRSW